MNTSKTFTYVYDDPLDKGMKKSHVSLSELYKMGLRKRGNVFINKTDVYFDDQKILIEFRLTLLAKFLLFVIFPLNVVMYGIYETTDDFKRLLQQTKYGSFSTEVVFVDNKRQSDFAQKLIEKIYKM